MAATTGDLSAAISQSMKYFIIANSRGIAGKIVIGEADLTIVQMVHHEMMHVLYIPSLSYYCDLLMYTV